jgi:hypothetical protein
VRKSAHVEDNRKRDEVARARWIIWKCMYMYAGFSGDNRVCTRVSMDTIMYMRGRTMGFFGQKQVRTGLMSISPTGGLQQICKLGISQDFSKFVLLRGLVCVLKFW